MAGQLVAIQAFDASGNPVAGAKFYTWAAGTTTPKSAYSDEAGTIALSNPVVTNAHGIAGCWLKDGIGDYKIALKSADDSTFLFRTIDNYTPATDNILQIIGSDIETARTEALDAAEAAAAAQAAAETAQTAAETAQTAAESAETGAASSASQASTSATNAASSASAASSSASAASTSESNAAASETLASEWATKTSAIVDATDYSAKEFAIGTQASTGGSAKNWAQQTGADVTGAATNSRSAKSWAQDNLAGATLGGSAKDWAQSASLPDGTNKSAKTLATEAATSASNAATSETNAGTSEDNALASELASAISEAECRSRFLSTSYANAAAAVLDADAEVGTLYNNTTDGSVHRITAITPTPASSTINGITTPEQVALSSLVSGVAPSGTIANQATAEAGSDNTKIMSPLRSAQQLAARLPDYKASSAEALTGTNDTKYVTPLSANFIVPKHVYPHSDFGIAAGSYGDDYTTELTDAATSGRRVALPPGVIYGNITEWNHNTELEGAGEYRRLRSNLGSGTQFWPENPNSQTIIRYVGAGGSNTCAVNFSSRAAFTDNTAFSNLRNVRIRNLTIDANGNSIASGGGRNADGGGTADIGLFTNRAGNRGVLIENVTVIGSKRVGFVAGGLFTGTMRGLGFYDNENQSCSVGYNYLNLSNHEMDVHQFHIFDVQSAYNGAWDVIGGGNDADGAWSVGSTAFRRGATILIGGRACKFSNISQERNGGPLVWGGGGSTNRRGESSTLEHVYIEGNEAAATRALDADDGDIAVGLYIMNSDYDDNRIVKHIYAHGGASSNPQQSIRIRNTVWTSYGTVSSMPGSSSGFGPSDAGRWLRIEDFDGNFSGSYSGIQVASETDRFYMRASKNGPLVFTGFSPANEALGSGTPVAAQGGSAIYSGSGSPESAVTAPIGSIYMRTDGSTGTSVYRKESGTGNTGWVATGNPTSGTVQADILRANRGSNLTISGGAITVTHGWHFVDTEASAATDDLDTINGGVAGMILFLRAVNNTRTINIKHNTGNIYTTANGADMPLTHTADYVAFIYDDNLTRWVPFSFSDNVA